MIGRQHGFSVSHLLPVALAAIAFTVTGCNSNGLPIGEVPDGATDRPAGTGGAGTGGTGSGGIAGTGTGGTVGGTGGTVGGTGGGTVGGTGGMPMPSGSQTVGQRGGDPARTGHFIRPMLTRARAATMASDATFMAAYAGTLTGVPLYMENGPGGKGAFFVATQSNNVYAFDETTGAQLWVKNVGPTATGACDAQSKGIMSTPALDPVSRTLTVGKSPCLERRTLADHIQIWLRQSDLDRRLAFQVTDTPEGVHFVVRRDGAVLGERILLIRDVPCAEMTAAVGLGIASAIDATILADLTARPTREISVAATGIILIGVLASATPAVAPSVNLALGQRVSLRASGLATAAAKVALASGTADMTLAAGRLDACVARASASDRAVVRVCLGAMAGAVSARGAGFPAPATTTLPWLAPALRLEGDWKLFRAFSLVLGVDGFLPVLRPAVAEIGVPAADVPAAERWLPRPRAQPAQARSRPLPPHKKNPRR